MRRVMALVLVGLMLLSLVAQAAVKSVMITAAGDVTIGGDPRKKAPASEKFYTKLYAKYRGGFLSRVRPYFRHSGELTLVNLESNFTTATRHADKSYVLRGKPSLASILSKAGVDVVGHANNHAMDFGTVGALDTRRAVVKRGMSYIAGGISAVRKVNGIRVGFAAFNATGGAVERAMEAEVKQLSGKCDIVVVSFHWGDEFRYRTTSGMRALGHAAVQAGADLVVGHHSHVVGGIERYKGRYIVYGLGTLSSVLTTPKDMDTLLFQQKFKKDSATGKVTAGKVRLVPCSMSGNKKVNDGRPTVLKGAARKRVLDKVRYYSKEFSETLPAACFS